MKRTYTYDKRIFSIDYPYNLLTVIVDEWDRSNLVNGMSTSLLYEAYKAKYNYSLSKYDMKDWIITKFINGPKYIEDIFEGQLNDFDRTIIRERYEYQKTRPEAAKAIGNRTIPQSVYQAEKLLVLRLFQHILHMMMYERHERDIRVYRSVPDNVPIDIMDLPLYLTKRLRTEIFTMGELKKAGVDKIYNINRIGKGKLITIYETANKYMRVDDDLLLSRVIR